MKNNLSAKFYSFAHLSRISLGFLLLGLLFTLGGCSSQPTAVERFIFDAKTNAVSTISLTTNTVAGVAHVEAQTNISQDIIWTIKPTVTTVANIGSSVVDSIFPGFGKLALVLLTGFLSIFGLNRQRKLTEASNRADEHYERANTLDVVSENFAQSIEVLREVLKQTPQGQILDAKIVDMMQHHQIASGVIREAVSIVEKTVSNEDAKAAAAKLRKLIEPI